MSLLPRVALASLLVITATLFWLSSADRGVLNITIDLQDDTRRPVLVTVFAVTDDQVQVVFEGLIASSGQAQLRLKPVSPLSLTRLEVLVEHPGYASVRK